MATLFSLAYLTIPNTHPVDQIEIAARCGYDGVGLRPISQQLPGESDFKFSIPTIFQGVKAALTSTGVGLMDVELGRIADQADVRSYEPELDLAAQLGAKYVISSVWTPDRARAKDQLAALCQLAAKYDLGVNLEYMSFSELHTLQETLAFMDELAQPNLTLMVDHLHAHRANTTPDMLRGVAPERLGFVHLCDGPGPIPPMGHPDMTTVARSARLYCGEGGINLAGLIKATPSVPYYSIELPNAYEMARRGKLGHAKRCLDTAKSFFDQHGLT